MATSIEVWKGTRKIGTGTMSAAGTSITSFTLLDAVYNTTENGVFGRNVRIVMAGGGQQGYSWSDRIVSDNGSGTVTVLNGCPVVGA